jgi:hypothetical protein
MMRLLTKPVNIVLIGQDKNIYDSSGNVTSATKGDWQKKTPHWVDLSIQCTRGSDGAYRGFVKKCRIGDYKQQMITPITYESIVAWMSKEFPWRGSINPQGITSIDQLIGKE